MINFFKDITKTIRCPECKGKMKIIVTDSINLADYCEIKRKYKCKKCKHECNSIELISIHGEIESITENINRLYDSIDTFHSALSVLQKAARKLNEAQKSGIYDGPVMN